MTDMPIYFGRPGNLHELPYPRGGADITRLRTRATFSLGSGGVRMSQLPGGKRRLTYAWQSLDVATYAIIQAFDQGHEGVGPFAVLDPSQVNMLTDNQSAATSVTNSTDNFTIAGSGCTTTSDATVYNRGPASLRWDFAVGSPSGALLTLDSPSTQWPGIPIVNTPDASLGDINPGFENGTTAWAPTNATIDASTDFVQSGSFSGKLTASGGSVPRVDHSSSQTFCTPGQSVHISGWLYAPVALPGNAQLSSLWFTSAGGFLSSSPVNVSLTAGVWTYVEDVFAAPSTAGRVGRQFAMAGTPTAGTLLYGDDIRIRAGRSLCFSFVAKGGGSDSAVTLTPQLQWLDSTGTLLSTSSGTAMATNGSTWTEMSVAATTNLDAVYVRPAIAATAASVSAGAKVYLDEFQLEAGSAPTTWRPGTGVLPVQVVSLPESWPWGFPGYRSGATLVLQEVGT